MGGEGAPRTPAGARPRNWWARACARSRKVGPQARSGPLQEEGATTSVRWRRQGAGPSLVHVPDLRQQRRQLLVLEPQGKDLLRVHRAQRAQAHEFH